MYYSVVRITPDRITKSWSVSVEDLDGDRVAEDRDPMALGFYIFPRTIGVKKAFQALKKKMIQRHKEELAKLQESLEKLEKLTMPDRLVTFPRKKKGKKP